MNVASPLHPLRARSLAVTAACVGLVLWSAAAISAIPGASLPTTETESFIRYETPQTNHGRLQTAVKTYARGDGITVSLIGAVHVADPAYYRELQQLFGSYDALLYELITDVDMSVKQEVSSDSAVSQMQLGMTSLLDLSFQLDAIDYAKPNFVHADLDPATFASLQAERGESLLSLMFKVMMEEQQRIGEGKGTTLNSWAFLGALLSPNRAYHLKHLIGQQMDQIESLVAGIDQGSDGRGSVLVSSRNEHAVQVLHEQIRAGKRRLGIFYGAGHMPDLETRLQLLGFGKTQTRWLTAWDVKP